MLGHTMVWIRPDVPYGNVDDTYLKVLLIERSYAVELSQLRKSEDNAETERVFRLTSISS